MCWYLSPHPSRSPRTANFNMIVMKKIWAYFKVLCALKQFSTSTVERNYKWSPHICAIQHHADHLLPFFPHV